MAFMEGKMCFFSSSEKAFGSKQIYLHLENYDLQDVFFSKTI
jgi:hypothetical protein